MLLFSERLDDNFDGGPAAAANETTTASSSSSSSATIQRLNGLGSTSDGVGSTSTTTTTIHQPTVWTEFARLAAQNDIVANLGQGFPDWTPPQFAIDSLVQAATCTTSKNNNPHQYTRPAGHPALVHQLARRYSMHLQPRTVQPLTEVAVTVGASQALYLTLQSLLLQRDDQVILLEPCFDLYSHQIALAGGIPVYVPLEFVPYDTDKNSGGDWKLNGDTLRNAVSSVHTKAILLNSPHNPTGKVFTRSEMEIIAAIVLEHAHPDCIVISDEVYKYIVHSPPPPEDGDTTASLPLGSNTENNETPPLHCLGHVHFASLPGMWERTITISSAGKTFSATGWQIGWCIGPSNKIAKIQNLLPYVQFCASTVLQEALARTLVLADQPYQTYDSYYDYLRALYTDKRDLLSKALSQAGLAVPDWKRTPGGGFFIFARLGPEILSLVPADRVNVPNAAAPNGVARHDWAVCQWLAEEHGLVCIPSSPFFSKESAAAGASDRFVRIAFCKTDATIQAAARAFQSLHDGNASTNDYSTTTTSPSLSLSMQKEENVPQ